MSDSTINVGESMRSYFIDVVKTFDQHKGANEFVTFHGPATHGHESMHSQFTLVNSALSNACKIKFTE